MSPSTEVLDTVSNDAPEAKPKRLYTLMLSLSGLALTGFGAFVIAEAPDIPSKIYGSVLVISGVVLTLAPPVCYYQGDVDLSPHRLSPENRM